MALVGISHSRLNKLDSDITGGFKLATSTAKCPAIGCDTYWSPLFPDGQGDFIDVSYCSEYPNYQNFKNLDCQGQNKCRSYGNPQNCSLTPKSGWTENINARDACIVKCHEPMKKVAEECSRLDSEDLSCGDKEKADSCSCVNSCFKVFSEAKVCIK